MRMYSALIALCFASNIIAMEPEIPKEGTYREQNLLAIICSAIKRAPSLDAALEEIQTLNTSLLDDLAITRLIIEELYREFGLGLEAKHSPDMYMSPSAIAERLNTKGSKEWLELRPDEIQLVNLIKEGFWRDARKLMINRDIYVDARSSDGGYRTAFMVAVSREYFALAEFLLDRGAAVDARDVNGNTALINSVHEKGASAIEFLLKNGADPEIKNKNGQTAVDLAVKYDLKDIIELFANRKEVVIIKTAKYKISKIYMF